MFDERREEGVEKEGWERMGECVGERMREDEHEDIYVR